MNFQAAVKGIAPAGGIRPASHITASSVSATKAEPAAHFGGVPPRSPYGVQGAARCGLIPRLHLAAVIEGSLGILGDSDLSRSSTLSGQRSNTDERHIGRQRSGLSPRTVGATSRSGGLHGLSARMELKSMSHWSRNLGNPCAEKVSAHRSRQNKGAASLTKAPSAFRKIGEAVNRQGTLTITGSNVRLGTEMPVALSLFP